MLTSWTPQFLVSGIRQSTVKVGYFLPKAGPMRLPTSELPEGKKYWKCRYVRGTQIFKIQILDKILLIEIFEMILTNMLVDFS